MEEQELQQQDQLQEIEKQLHTIETQDNTEVVQSLEELKDIIKAYILTQEEKEVQKLKEYEKQQLLYQEEQEALVQQMNDEIGFRENIISNLEEMNLSLYTRANYEDIEALNSSVVDLQDIQQQNDYNFQTYMNYIIALLLLGIGFFALFKFCMFFISRFKDVIKLF